MTVSINDVLEIARTVAREAGELAVRRRAEGVEVAAQKTSAVDIVTHTDREVEALIRSRLAELRPDDGFYGEESGSAGSSSGLTWIVDPIDGTVNFLYGIPSWAISIAVVEGDPEPLSWRALAGCVLNPVTGEEFWAARGEGAFLNGTPLRASSPERLAVSLLGTGFAYDPAKRVVQGTKIAQLLGRVRDIRRIGAASLDLCAVAAGRLDAYVERGLQPYDHAAGVLVAEEAGAVVLTPDGAQASSDLTFVCAPSIAAELAHALADVDF